MYSFFRTARGSTYARMPNGMTIRTKNSAGKGHGETDKAANWCLFVSPEVAREYLVGPNSVGFKYRLGYCQVMSNGNPGKFTMFGEAGTIVPSGCQAAVAVLTEDNKWYACIKAETMPQAGLIPVEHRYEGELSIRHVGNAIVEVKELSL